MDRFYITKDTLFDIARECESKFGLSWLNISENDMGLKVIIKGMCKRLDSRVVMEYPSKIIYEVLVIEDDDYNEVLKKSMEVYGHIEKLLDEHDRDSWKRDVFERIDVLHKSIADDVISVKFSEGFVSFDMKVNKPYDIKNESFHVNFNRNIVGGDVLNEVNEVIEKIKNGFKIIVTVFG